MVLKHGRILIVMVLLGTGWYVGPGCFVVTRLQCWNQIVIFQPGGERDASVASLR